VEKHLVVVGAGLNEDDVHFGMLPPQLLDVIV
jgi:hypothetical protein